MLQAMKDTQLQLLRRRDKIARSSKQSGNQAGSLAFDHHPRNRFSGILDRMKEGQDLHLNTFSSMLARYSGQDLIQF